MAIKQGYKRVIITDYYNEQLEFLCDGERFMLSHRQGNWEKPKITVLNEREAKDIADFINSSIIKEDK